MTRATRGLSHPKYCYLFYHAVPAMPRSSGRIAIVVQGRAFSFGGCEAAGDWEKLGHEAEAQRPTPLCSSTPVLLLAENCLLKGLGDCEPDLFPCRDLDGLAGLGVTAHTGLEAAPLEGSQVGDLQGLALAHRFDNGIYQITEH